MDIVNLIVILLVILGIAGISLIAYVFLGDKDKSEDIRGLMSTGGRELSPQALSDVKDVQRTREKKRKKTKKEADSLNKRLFKAGLYSQQDRDKYLKKQIIAPLIAAPITTYLLAQLGGPLMMVLGGMVGLMIGYLYPISWLDKQIGRREEDTSFYLPLVIEQISIGVSSSLDVGPCIAHLVDMARERASFNPVTEMFVHCEKLVRSGLSLEDALAEVAETNGITDVKHAFMFLSQCARHGGEVSKQLQELADSVMAQRQTQVEAKIAALPVKATGPLASVFCGFFAILMAGLFVRLLSAFSV